MRSILLYIVNGKDEEYYRILLLSAFGFSLGIFGATYLVASETLFISRLNTETDAPIAFFFQGIFGAFVSFLFIILQRSFNYQSVARISMLVCLAMIWVLTLVSYFQHGSSPEWVIFTSFVIYKPILALTLIIFWGVFGRIFSLRAFKRLASGIDSGLSLSSIVAFFTIPFAKVLFGEHLENFFWVSSFALSISFACLLLLCKLPFEGTQPKIDLVLDPKSTGAYSLRKSRYIRLLSLFVVCSVLTAAIVDYNFLNVSKVQFPKETDLTNFLSFFSALVVITGFVIQVFLNDRILELYGTRASLLILPLFLLIYAVIVTLMYWSFGQELMRIDIFLFLFVFTALSKLFTDALRDSLESPTLKLFFLPIPVKFRFNVQTFIEGFVKEMGILVSGLCLIGLGALGIVDWVVFTHLLFVVIAVWAIATYSTYGQYRKILTQILSSNQVKSQSAAGNNFNIRVFLTKQLENQPVKNTILLLKLIERIDPALLETIAETYTRYKFDPQVKLFLLEQIERNTLFGAYETLQKQVSREQNQAVLDKIKQVLTKIDYALDLAQDWAKINEMLLSESIDDRLLIAQLMSKAHSDKTYKVLPLLLKDASYDVRVAALTSCGQAQIEEILPLVADALDDIGFENQAISALIDYGEMSLPTLEKLFYLQETSQNTRLDIIRTAGFIGGKKAIEFLLKKLNYPDRKVGHEVLYSLSRCSWQAKANTTSAGIILNFLETKIETYWWNSLAIEELEDKKENEPVRWALKDETEQNLEDIFLYLTLLYDKKSVALVKENIESGTDDGISYAMELLDIFLSEDLKRRLIPVLENIPWSEKYKKLTAYYHRDRYNSEQLLENILLRDFNEMGKFAKSAALFSLASNESVRGISNSIASLFFADNELLHQSAAYCMAVKDYDYFRQACKRIAPERAKKTLQLISEIVLQPYNFERRSLIFEKILFLKQIPATKSISAEYLAEMAILIKEEFWDKGDWLSKKDTFRNLPIYILVSGSVMAIEDGKPIYTFEKGELINEVFYTKFDLSQVDLLVCEPSHLYRISSSLFFENMTDSYRLTEQIVNNSLFFATKGLEVAQIQ